jgi:hypothetical protein
MTFSPAAIMIIDATIPEMKNQTLILLLFRGLLPESFNFIYPICKSK